MPSNDLDHSFIESTITIRGLRSPKISLTADGVVNFGCLKVHVLDMQDYPDKTIAAQFGENGVKWWNKYKTVLLDFFSMCYQERNLLELKYSKKLKENPKYLNEMIGNNFDDQLLRDLDVRSKVHRENT